MKRLATIFGIVAGLVFPALGAAKPSAEDIASAVVGIRSHIPKEARTAKFLGTRREGSGVIIDSNGLILTIGYVILEADKMLVRERGGKSVPASCVGYDSNSGLAVVRALKKLKGKPIQLGASGQVKAESPVLVVRHQSEGGLQSAMVVSRRTFAGYWEYLLEDAIFTAPPMDNFAGAALIGSDLRLIGIGSLFVRDAATAGENFPGNMFVPIDKLYPVLADLIATGRPTGPAKPWLGVYVTEAYGRVVVTRVAAGGPAAARGLGEDDIILKVEGQQVLGMEDFYRKVWRRGNAGVAVKLSVLRQSEIEKITLQSTDRYLHYSNLPMR